MAAAVEQPYSDKSEHRSATPDSIDKELDWLIEKDEKEKVSKYDSDTDQSDRALSPLPLNSADKKSTTQSPSPGPSPQPPSPSQGHHKDASDSQNSLQQESSPSRVFPARDSLAIDATDAGSGPDDDDYLSYSDSQRKANEELTSMKLDLGYTDEEPPPEYDVAERVRKLNEELANEPPPDDDKERSIKFKENLVDLVAPPPPDDSEDDTVPNQEGQPKSPREATSPEDNGSYHSEQDADRETDSCESSGRLEQQSEEESSSDKQQDNKVVVERNGKFDFVSVDDLTAEERELYRIPDSNTETEERREHQPKPPNGPRPNTSGGETMTRGHGHNSRRVQSAKTRPQLHSEWNEEFTYQSPYAMTPEQRRELAEKQREEQKRKKQEEKYKERDERERSQENEEAFKAWLRKKQEQKSQRRWTNSQQRSPKDDRSSEDNKSDSEKAYKEWLKSKKEQAKKERELKKQEQKEFEEGWCVRPREECDRAYREWLKRKNAEIRRQREEDKQRARVHRLWLRRSRKSQQLAKAIKQAQAFRYVDYYGYRF